MQQKSAVALLGALGLSLAVIVVLLILSSNAAAHRLETDAPPAQPIAPQAATIVLTQTVGTNPAVCAATKSITLPPGGGSATYCYTVRNVGSIALTRHTLVDDRLGAILSNFPYNLQPGASAFITQTAVITTTTVSSSTWTASNPGPIDVVSASDTATVNVTPTAPAVVMTKTVGTNPAVCAATGSIILPVGGGSVTYCYTVRNTGNIDLTRHTLVDDRLGTILSNFPYTLKPGATAFLTQTATITTTTVNSSTWTAFNPGPTDTALSTDIARVVIEHWLYAPLVRR